MPSQGEKLPDLRHTSPTAWTLALVGIITIAVGSVDIRRYDIGVPATWTSYPWLPMVLMNLGLVSLLACLFADRPSYQKDEGRPLWGWLLRGYAIALLVTFVGGAIVVTRHWRLDSVLTAGMAVCGLLEVLVFVEDLPRESRR